MVKVPELVTTGAVHAFSRREPDAAVTAAVCV